MTLTPTHPLIDALERASTALDNTPHTSNQERADLAGHMLELDLLRAALCRELIVIERGRLTV